MIKDRDYRRVERAIHWIRENSDRQPDLSAMAAAADLSPHHFSRLFRRWAGIPPHQFLRTVTLDAAKERLKQDGDLLGVAVDVGLSGPGRLHDLFVQMEAMTPAEYRHGGRDLDIRFGIADSPFGACLIAQTGRGICGLSFIDSDPDSAGSHLQRRWPAASLTRDDPMALRQSRALFEASGTRGVRLHVKGTNFQVQVWRALLTIPLGGTSSYGEIAGKISRPGAARAVGRAVGDNPVAFLIPCHRVLRGDGGLGGYRWRPDRKAAMLAWEGAVPAV
jgi:AraC family transcriptional regulator of adaptative response/methylated-DNA-[protein]-cysteine methyltransferase